MYIDLYSSISSKCRECVAKVSDTPLAAAATHMCVCIDRGEEGILRREHVHIHTYICLENEKELVKESSTSWRTMCTQHILIEIGICHRTLSCTCSAAQTRTGPDALPRKSTHHSRCHRFCLVRDAAARAIPSTGRRCCSEDHGH